MIAHLEAQKAPVSQPRRMVISQPEKGLRAPVEVPENNIPLPIATLEGPSFSRFNI